MTGQTADNLICYVACGLWLVALLLVPAGLRSRYLYRSGNELAFRRPPAQCAFLAVVALMCLLTPLAESGYDLRLYGATRPDHWPSLAVFAAFGLVGAALLLWGGQPQELVVDLGRSTYRRTTGWPPFRRVRTGPLSDLAGVGAESGVRSGYLVYVHWPGRGGRMTVSRFRWQDEAEHCADDLAAALGVSRLPPLAVCRFLPGVSPTPAQHALHLTPHGPRLVRLRKSRRGQSGCGRR